MIVGGRPLGSPISATMENHGSVLGCSGAGGETKTTLSAAAGAIFGTPNGVFGIDQDRLSGTTTCAARSLIFSRKAFDLSCDASCVGVNLVIPPKSIPLSPLDFHVLRCLEGTIAAMTASND